jgi:hypothetical protein
LPSDARKGGQVGDKTTTAFTLGICQPGQAPARPSVSAQGMTDQAELRPVNLALIGWILPQGIEDRDYVVPPIAKSRV